MDSLEGPPLKKTLENGYRVEIHVHCRIFKASSKKKIKLIIFIVWFLRRIDKMPKKGS